MAGLSRFERPVIVQVSRHGSERIVFDLGKQERLSNCADEEHRTGGKLPGPCQGLLELGPRERSRRHRDRAVGVIPADHIVGSAVDVAHAAAGIRLTVGKAKSRQLCAPR